WRAWVRGADGRDAGIGRPAAGALGGESNARRARAHRCERRLRVTPALRIDLHGGAVLKRRDRAAKRVFVAVHLRRIILRAIDGQAAESAQHRSDEPLVEQQRLRERPRGQAGDTEDHELIAQAFLMVRYDDHWTVRDPPADGLDLL